jgi:hypothetical protein
MTSSSVARRALAPLLFVLCLPGAAAAQRSAQDIESARQLYHQGLELRDRGDMKGALEKFRAAHALGNTPITGIELCRAHAALRQPVEAREVCLGVARIPPLAQETSRSQEARAEAGKIAEAERPKIGALRIRVVGVPAGREPTVTVDGAAVPAAALGETRAVNPGAHVITAKVGSGVETRGTVETREGETREIEMVVQAPPSGEKPAAAAPAPPGGASEPAREAPRKSNTFATVMFAVGGGAALIGAAAGLAAISAEGDLADKCPDKQCGRENHDELSRAKTWGNVSTVFFVLGGVALGAGLVSVVTASSSKAARRGVRPVIGLGGIGLDGRF